MKSKILLIITAFLLGVFSSIAINHYFPYNEETRSITTTYVIDSNDEEDSSFITWIIGSTNEEKASPYDRITEDKIHVMKDKVVIEIESPVWARFTDTNSMDPTIDIGTNAIEVIPKEDCSDVHVGDIVSYESKYATGTIIHRVIERGHDSKGYYFIMKGDNNERNDPGKIRCSQIKRIVVALIY